MMMDVLKESYNEYKIEDINETVKSISQKA